MCCQIFFCESNFDIDSNVVGYVQSVFLFNVHRRRVHPVLVNGAIRRTHCAEDVDVVLTTSKSRNVLNVAIQPRRCVHVSCIISIIFSFEHTHTHTHILIFLIQ